KALVRQCAEKQGKPITVVDALADGAFGLPPEQFREKLIATARTIADRIDVLVMAQGSMAYAEGDVATALGLPVFSSVRFGAAAVRREVEKLRQTRG
ncbi:MAG: Asp/Glu/hydantoin racemase, partial [Planctomycetes bacterium]|nr:Asp/Glu/hydantoin racemase [Planctomycetota bacterium]